MEPNATLPLQILNERKMECSICEHASNKTHKGKDGHIIDLITSNTQCDINRIKLLKGIKNPNYSCPDNRFTAHDPKQVGKVNLNGQVGIREHRSGWQYAIDSLRCLHSDAGVICDMFFEKSHSWEINKNAMSKVIPYTSPWIGFVHNTHNAPRWFDYTNSPQAILSRKITKESLKHCKGLFTLSEYGRDWYQNQVDVPVESLIHPTEIPPIKFSMKRYIENRNKKIIQLGFWMRRIFSIQQMPTERFLKVWLVPSRYALEFRDEVESRTVDTFDIKFGKYEQMSWVDNTSYDQILSENLAFVHLYDVGACNSIIECIVRNTPVLTNPLPANIEYLGKDYPLYFETLDEAVAKSEDNSLVNEAYEYLSGMDKSVFTQCHFRRTFENSSIYRSL